jgi:hypothetical protein
MSDPLQPGPDAKHQMPRRPLALVLAGKFRACWHILRGRCVIYGITITGGAFESAGSADLVFIACRYVAEFTVNGIPALELRNRSGDVMVRRKAPAVPSVEG